MFSCRKEGKKHRFVKLKASLRKEQLGQPCALVDANLHAKIIPGTGLLHVMVCVQVRGVPLEVLLPVPAPSPQVDAGWCWLGGTWHPQSCSSAWLAISALPPNQSQSSLAKNPAEVGMKTLCAEGWLRGHREMGLVMGWERSVPPAPEAAQCKVQCFCCGQRWAHINMPTSVLKPLKCRHTLASNCSGESGPLGAVTF